MEVGSIFFEKYKIVDLLGKGGSSEVFLVENVRVGNKWAMKKSNKVNSNINLLAEPNILKDLNHVAIPKIIDIEEDKDAIYIIEEYVQGINLKEYKESYSNIQLDQIIEWALQLCNVLKYLHNRKPLPIIYRDIKPENIMLMDNGNIKLIDFGIAREFKEESQNDTIPIGTKGYAAPEQYGIGQSDERTDIFSLGVTLYYLLTGKNLSHPPYKIQNTIQLNNDKEERLFKIVLKCCEILPDQRYQRVEDLEKELHLLNNEDSLIKVEQEYFQNWDKNNLDNALPSVKKIITIGVLGVEKGLGVTHTCVMLAGYLSKKNKVAVIELNDSKHFKEIALIIKDDKEIAKRKFIYNKVHYYWDIDYGQFISLYREKYDFLILDLGSYLELRDMDEFVRTDIRLVIGHGMDWKIKEISKFYLENRDYDPNNNWYYVLPFMDKKSIREIKSKIENKVFFLPYNINPFVVNQETKKIFEQILHG